MVLKILSVSTPTLVGCFEKIDMFRMFKHIDAWTKWLPFCKRHFEMYYRQTGELWTLNLCLQIFTHSMVVEMDGNISRVLFCSIKFSKLKLNGRKFGTIKRKNIAGQSYPGNWGSFGHPGETLGGRRRLLCTSNDLEWLPSTRFMMNKMQW